MQHRKILLLVSCLFLLGCGANKSALTTLSSRNTDGSLAECNKFSTSGLTGLIATDEQIDKLRVRMTAVSADFGTSTRNLNLSFQGWGFQADGSRVKTSQPFPINFQYRGDGKNILSSDIQAMNYTTFNGLQEKLKTTYGIGTSTLTDTMKNFDIVVSGADLRFDVIQVVVTEGTSKTPVWADVLLPAFEMNPDTYADTHPTELVNLHPFRFALGSYKGDSSYQAQAEALCAP